MGENMDKARNKLMEARGRLQQAEETRSDHGEHGYYVREAGNRLAEAIEAILDALEDADDEALLE